MRLYGYNLHGEIFRDLSALTPDERTVENIHDVITKHVTDASRIDVDTRDGYITAAIWFGIGEGIFYYIYPNEIETGGCCCPYIPEEMAVPKNSLNDKTTVFKG